MTIKVFISYSHKDEEFKESLVEHLSALKRNSTINSWDDRKILAGQDWKDEISENLKESEI
ncbi:TPA: toll/interleukin-1 receptor domain-containing protein, partial [Yersinia enterocolitica]|nr:toll/interleukin-1 receptor domain-containing protein [Yersinia enterocolitica]